jgi:twinkle protein
MAKQLGGEFPCLRDNCTSSNAVRKYEDGSAFCFKCEHPYKVGEYDDSVMATNRAPSLTVPTKSKLEDIELLPIRGDMSRGINMDVAKFFNMKVRVNGAGNLTHHYYQYPDGWWKERSILDKKFKLISEQGGAPPKLFGQDKFAGGGRILIITEGELDAMAVAQANLVRYEKIYPVVSVASATTYEKQIIQNREWIRTFQKVVICMDEDVAGQEAAQKIIRIIGLDKCVKTKLPAKDANKVLLDHGVETLLSAIFSAEKIIPSGIITKEELWDALVKFNETESLPYPPCLEHLNTKLKGIRQGEITLFVSGTSSGKSTMMREIMLHILETTDETIGIISLEESPAETARKLAGMALYRNPAKEEIPLEELKVGFDEIFQKDKVIVLDHQGSISDESIVDKLEYMCLSGCTRLFIDHITILTSEGAGRLEGNEAQDKIMNDLLRLVKKYPVWIGLVSHLRKAQSGQKSFEEGRLPSIDDIKGSGSIKQISFDIVGFARDLTAESEIARNTIMMTVLKSRFTGLTGRVQGSYYNFDTGRLVALSGDVIEEYTSVG